MPFSSFLSNQSTHPAWSWRLQRYEIRPFWTRRMAVVWPQMDHSGFWLDHHRPWLSGWWLKTIPKTLVNHSSPVGPGVRNLSAAALKLACLSFAAPCQLKRGCSSFSVPVSYQPTTPPNGAMKARSERFLLPGGSRRDAPSHSSSKKWRSEQATLYPLIHRS